MSSIRELIDGPAAVPDGPPLDAKALSRYFAQLADGVEEAYGAVYLQSDVNLITVRAMRLAPGEKPLARARYGETRISNPGMIRVSIGTVIAVVTGGGECFQAVGAYLKSLAN